MNAKVTRDLLEKEVNAKMEELEYLEPHSDEYKAAVDSLTKLTDRILEFEKVELDETKTQVNRQIEYEKIDVEEEKVENEKRDNKIKNWLTAAGIVVPTGLAVWGTFKSIKFEETGTITTIAGRNFFNKLFKK